MSVRVWGESCKGCCVASSGYIGVCYFWWMFEGAFVSSFVYKSWCMNLMSMAKSHLVAATHPLRRLKWFVSTGEQPVCYFHFSVAENVTEDNVLEALPWFPYSHITLNTRCCKFSLLLQTGSEFATRRGTHARNLLKQR